MGLDLSGATLSYILKMDFSLRQKGLNQTKMLQAKLPAVFNYFRGLKCSQMSLWRSQALYQKQVPGGLSQYRACCVNFRGWNLMTQAAGHCPDGCWSSCRLPKSSTQALDDIYLIRTTWLSPRSQDCGCLIRKDAVGFSSLSSFWPPQKGLGTPREWLAQDTYLGRNQHGWIA